MAVVSEEIVYGAEFEGMAQWLDNEDFQSTCRDALELNLDETVRFRMGDGFFLELNKMSPFNVELTLKKGKSYLKLAQGFPKSVTIEELVTQAKKFLAKCASHGIATNLDYVQLAILTHLRLEGFEWDGQYRMYWIDREGNVKSSNNLRRPRLDRPYILLGGDQQSGWSADHYSLYFEGIAPFRRTELFVREKTKDEAFLKLIQELRDRKEVP